MPTNARDVRMGFAVGGVLLAVLIVAFLAIHRNQNNKTVAFDKGAGDGRRRYRCRCDRIGKRPEQNPRTQSLGHA